MGLFKSKKGSIISDMFVLQEDVAQLKKGTTVEVALYDDHLELTAPLITKTPTTLQYAQITDVFHGMQSEIVEKNKSTIGRAVAGGLLFGGAGAIVGAISGAGTKKKTVSKLMFIISYTSSSGTDAFLSFEDTRRYNGRKLAKQLRELCGMPSQVGEQSATSL